jgi:hypothetical protein
MEQKEKWFKVLSKDLKAKDGGAFYYAPFVKSGDWLPEISDLKLCEKGYHVTHYWNMFFDSDTCRIFEVEVKGLVEEEDLVGVVEKAVCSSLKIVKEFKPKFDKQNNTGDRNTGYSNTGDRNTGYRNTGDRNTGDRNTGNWNTGNFHAGAFNTKDAEFVYLFDKPIKKKDYDKIEFPSYFFFNLDAKGDYKNSWKKSFLNASKEEKEATIKLPNFNFKVFEEITGITQKMLKEGDQQPFTEKAGEKREEVRTKNE